MEDREVEILEGIFLLKSIKNSKIFVSGKGSRAVSGCHGAPDLQIDRKGPETTKRTVGKTTMMTTTTTMTMMTMIMTMMMINMMMMWMMMINDDDDDDDDEDNDDDDQDQHDDNDDEMI